MNRVNLSQAYINAGAPGRAVPVLLGLIAENRNNALAWNNLCVAQTLLKDYKPAMEDCNHALAIEPDFQRAKNNLQWATDERDAALHAIAAANQAPVKHDAAFYLDQGLNELHVGEYDGAIADWQHTLQQDPRSALAANDIGTAYMMKKQPDEAIMWFNKALAFDPSLQIAKNNLAWADGEKSAVKTTP